MPFPAAERLVNLGQVSREGETSVFTPQNFLDVVAQPKSYDGRGANLTSGGAPTRVVSAEVSAPFFDVLGVQPMLGRGFQPRDNEPGQHRVVVLAHELCSLRFGSDPGIVGRTVQVEREPLVVAGVAPPQFAFPEGTELWMPLQYDDVFRTKSRGAWYLSVVGRLRSGVTAPQAHEELRTIMAHLEREYPDATNT